MLTILLYVMFVLSGLALMLLILVQEGKGGGLGDAFGGAGAQTFGVKAGGVNKVTAGLAATWIVSALLIHVVGRSSEDSGRFQAPDAPVPGVGAPVVPGTGENR